VVAGDTQDRPVALAEGGGADQPLARHPAEQWVELRLQRRARAVPAAVTKGDARRLREVVQRAVYEVDVVDVQPHAATVSPPERSQVRVRTAGD
jgi:hypothetical protein